MPEVLVELPVYDGAHADSSSNWIHVATKAGVCTLMSQLETQLSNGLRASENVFVSPHIAHWETGTAGSIAAFHSSSACEKANPDRNTLEAAVD